MKKRANIVLIDCTVLKSLKYIYLSLTKLKRPLNMRRLKKNNIEPGFARQNSTGWWKLHWVGNFGVIGSPAIIFCLLKQRTKLPISWSLSEKMSSGKLSRKWGNTFFSHDTMSNFVAIANQHDWLGSRIACKNWNFELAGAVDLFKSMTAPP